MLEARHLEMAEQAVAVLGNLRGGAMKIGQLASFVDVEFLPPEYRAIYQEKLAELRDAAPAMSWEKVKRVLEREWEEPIYELFESIEHEAVAAASIGQVHRGVLADGRRVAIKVQYPEIADALESDLDLASVMIRLGKAIAPGLDPRAGRRRAARASSRRARLRARGPAAADVRASVPRPSVRVRAGGGDFPVAPARARLANGSTGSSFEQILELDQAERDRVGEIVVRFFFGSADRIGRFNTDPHPGNYLLMADGRMAFLDFGNTVTVGPEALAIREVRLPPQSKATPSGSRREPRTSGMCATSTGSIANCCSARRGC